MDKGRREEIRNHLDRVSRAILKLKKEFKEKPENVGDIEHRLYWAIRGADPYKAVCNKHNRKITKNDRGKFICGDCIEEDITNDLDTYDENLWYNPNDEPTMKIRGIQYGDKVPFL
jgi:hypothetical protein